jgi:hypothetical protein
MLLEELRALKEAAGYDLRSLERKTHASRSSWGRWLSGETWIPMDSAGALAELCGGDRRRLEILWELADQARRAEFPTATIMLGPDPRPDGISDGPGSDLRSGTRTGVGTGTGSTGFHGTGDPADRRAARTRQTEPAPRVPASRSGQRDSAVDASSDTVTDRVNDTLSDPPGVTTASDRPGTGRWTPRQRVIFLVAIVIGIVTASTAGVLLRDELWPRRQAATPTGTTSPPAQITPVQRSRALARARSWHPHEPARIPYDQAATYQGYRMDGSGYASMILGLPKPGPNSTMLVGPDYTRQIPMVDLRPGDLIVNPMGDATVRQVIVFDSWADPGHISYWAYQQRRRYGTDHLVLREGLEAGSPYHGFRPRNIRDDNPADRRASAT